MSEPRFAPGDGVVIYLPLPWKRAQPTGVVQNVAAYTVEGEAAYDVLMDDGNHPQVVTVRERYIEGYGVFTVAAQEAAKNE